MGWLKLIVLLVALPVGLALGLGLAMAFDQEWMASVPFLVFLSLTLETAVGLALFGRPSRQI